MDTHTTYIKRGTARRNVSLPDDVWQHLKRHGNASAAICRLAVKDMLNQAIAESLPSPTICVKTPSSFRAQMAVPRGAGSSPSAPPQDNAKAKG